MFIWSKLGQNLSEIDIRIFARIKKVIWDQLLATKAESVQSCICIFVFRVKRDKVKIFSGKISLFRCFPLCVIRSPRRLFFRLNHLRIVWKRCFHTTLRSQTTRRSKSVSSSFVLQQQIRPSMRIEHNKLKWKNRDIFRWDIYHSSCFVEILLIQSQVVSLNHFDSRIIKAQLSTLLWKICLQRIFQVFLQLQLTC